VALAHDDTATVDQAQDTVSPPRGRRVEAGLSIVTQRPVRGVRPLVPEGLGRRGRAEVLHAGAGAATVLRGRARPDQRLLLERLAEPIHERP